MGTGPTTRLLSVCACHVQLNPGAVLNHKYTGENAVRASGLSYCVLRSTGLTNESEPGEFLLEASQGGFLSKCRCLKSSFLKSGWYEREVRSIRVPAGDIAEWADGHMGSGRRPAAGSVACTARRARHLHITCLPCSCCFHTSDLQLHVFLLQATASLAASAVKSWHRWWQRRWAPPLPPARPPSCGGRRRPTRPARA